MDYRQALHYIENTSKFGSKLGLDNISKLLELLGNPQDKLRIIHVAGTNGKGSTCSYISNLLIGQGYDIGLYTSPFLEEFNERIRINNINIDDDVLAYVISKVKNCIDIMLMEGCDHPTEFEIITAAAYVCFEQKNVDFVVLEVGLGGRLDATNTCRPVVCAITSISLDHTDYLGNSIEEIAGEKGGIIKTDTPVVLYGQTHVVEKTIKGICNDKNAQLYITQSDKIEILDENIQGQTVNMEILNQKYSMIKLKLLGRHQGKNLAVAFTLIKVLEEKGFIYKINLEKLYKSILDTKWPGRMELLLENPMTIIDGAHNVDGALNLGKTIESYLFGKRITLVLGMLKDKDIKSVAEILIPKVERLIITVPNSPRAASTQEIHTIIESLTRDKRTIQIEEISKIEDAVEYAQSNVAKDEVVLYAGSLYMIGEVRTQLRKKYGLK
ncbi:MAG: folylpolyglutamate synthase/dihydrofolate synthase family protein [Proteocatella sp.]